MFKMTKTRKNLIIGAIALTLVAVLTFICLSGAIRAAADYARLESYHFVVEDELQYLPPISELESTQRRVNEGEETPYIMV
ncbi:MAG: hypothetical protein FWE22_02330 [Firmicutes bacterium]|nr:hypothetical protein [Bacillota bacterium]